MKRLILVQKERNADVTEEEIAVKLAEHGKEIGSLKHRASDLEEQNKTIQELVLSVKELAINMRAMMQEQKDQGSRLDTLEKEPAERWNSAKRTAFNTVVGAVAGAFATGMGYLILQFIK